MSHLFLATGFLLVASHLASAANLPWLDTPLEEGEATVVYLHHSGWLVRTTSCVLLFDPVAAPGRTILEPAGLQPAGLAGHDVVVLISHSHSDHWDPGVLSWAEHIGEIRFVLGWELGPDLPSIQMGTDRAVTRAAGATVYNVHHTFDAIPESAFLVEVDGLWIYHAGDHSHSRGSENATFRDNLSYLAGIAPRFDLMFTPTWGGELDAISALRPRVVFPMHDGGWEGQYARWAARPDVIALEVPVGIAEAPGHCFLYRAKKLQRCP